MLNVSIGGVEINKKRLRGVVNPDEIRMALMRTGFAIEERAKILSPVDTGRLRASISTNWNDSGLTHGAVESPAKPVDGVSQPKKESGEMAVVRVGTNVEYAIYQEMGTRKMAAQPFLIPAGQHGLRVFQKELDRLVDKNNRR